MASSKKRRKLGAIDKKARQVGPAPLKDGDRRRRTGTDMARDAVERKRRAREWTIDDGPPSAEI